MSIETESSEFIGWYEGYHAHDEKIAGLVDEIERLRNALEAILAKDENGFLITPLDHDLLEQAEKALANQ